MTKEDISDVILFIMGVVSGIFVYSCIIIPLSHKSEIKTKKEIPYNIEVSKGKCGNDTIYIYKSHDINNLKIK